MSAESIGNAYSIAIGRSDFCLPQPLGMAKDRSFYDRAMEALQERFPRDRPTQGKLAALAGVRQPSVNDWKEGAPAVNTGVRLAEALGVCVEWLYTERGPKRPPKAASDSLGPLSPIWHELTDKQRIALARYADFLKGEG